MQGWHKIQGEKGKEKEKEMVVGVNTKNASNTRKASHHCVKGIKIFQTSLWKAVFDGWTTPHVPLKQHGGIHVLLYAPTSFFL